MIYEEWRYTEHGIFLDMPCAYVHQCRTMVMEMLDQRIFPDATQEHLLSFAIGQNGYRMATGYQVDFNVHKTPDCGWDAPDGVDVKSTQHDPPYLKLNQATARRAKAKFYALVHVVVQDEEDDLAKFMIVGWASRHELREAPVNRNGHSPFHYLLPEQLRMRSNFWEDDSDPSQA